MLTRLRQPEYTGENRCLPCTIANSIITVALAIVVGAAVATVAARAAALVAAGAVLVVSLAAIWLRGYLVPKTPTLTKRYMPPWMLAWFGKAPASPVDQLDSLSSTEPADGQQLEATLREAHVLEPCDRQDDLCLTDAFLADWRRALDAVPAEPAPDRLTALLDLEATEGTIDRMGEAVVLRDGAQTVTAWPSPAAVRADLASGAVLREWLQWEPLSPRRRVELLHTVRLFLGECPDGSPASIKSETVESCCASREVAVVVCQDSGARLFEQPLETSS